MRIGGRMKSIVEKRWAEESHPEEHFAITVRRRRKRIEVRREASEKRRKSRSRDYLCSC
jgi:hypothetical protein